MKVICPDHGVNECILVNDKPFCPACYAEGKTRKFFKITKDEKGKVIKFPDVKSKSEI